MKLIIQFSQRSSKPRITSFYLIQTSRIRIRRCLITTVTVTILHGMMIMIMNGSTQIGKWFDLKGWFVGTVVGTVVVVNSRSSFVVDVVIG